MSTITTRSGKGSPLTNNEVDANFTNLNTDKLESADLAGYATLSGATFTGEVEATGFNGDLTGAILFKGQAGEALTKGDPVYISGISGNKTVVSKADANDASKMPCFGIVDATVSANADCSVVTFGTLQGLDTSSFSEGDELFVSDTGTLTTTAPTGESSQLQKIGKVTRSHASTGSIKVMGAGRTNAVPNLNDGQFFLGNGSNQAVSTDFTTSVLGEISAGTGIGISGSGVISNSAPDQTVSLTGGTGISTSGTYPNFTITNDSPDQTVSLTGAGTTTVSGTYPNFTITGAGTTYTAGTGLTLTGTEFSLTNSTSYMLNNADNDTVAYTNKTTFRSNTDGGTVNGNMSGLEVFQSTLNADAFMTFHVGGDVAGYFGLDGTTNDLFWGGWSIGAVKNKVWHAGNDGSGSGLDADTLDGVQASGFISTSLTQSSNIAIRNVSPTIYLRDTDHNSSMIHCNSSIFYVLRGGTDTTTWSQVNGRWPMQLNLTNNDATFGGNVTAYSDARLKENITSIGNSMEMFNQIDAKRYNWIDNGKNDIGFIAQDVKAAGLVEVVKEAENRDPETGELFDTHLTLDYSRMVSVLWDVVKELKAEIDELKGGD